MHTCTVQIHSKNAHQLTHILASTLLDRTCWKRKQKMFTCASSPTTLAVRSTTVPEVSAVNEPAVQHTPNRESVDTLAAKESEPAQVLVTKKPILSKGTLRLGLCSLTQCALDLIFSAAFLRETTAAQTPTYKKSRDKLFLTNESQRHMSIGRYFRRLVHNFGCLGETIVWGLALMDRLHVQNRLTIGPETSHNVLITALVCACKFVDDVTFGNDDWAGVGLISLSTLNAMELAFLGLLDNCLDMETSDYRATWNRVCDPLLHARCDSECNRQAVLLFDPF